MGYQNTIGMPAIISKLPNVGTTIFTVMSSLAIEHKAINLGQGFPDFPMSEELIALVNRAMQDGCNQYVHMNGLPALRSVLAEKIEALYVQLIHPDTDITVTPGGTYAIYTALTTILQPGDEVIFFEPAYDSYIPNIEINGAIPVPVPMKYPEDNSKGYTIDWELAKSKVTAKTKAIIINSPHNPTGAVLSVDDIEQLRQLVAGTGIFIISDEVYEHLIFDELPHQSILRYPDLWERSFVCFSFGKVYHCTGWKLGYCVAPAPLMAEFRKVHQFNCFTCNSPVQYALAAFIQQKDPYLQLGRFLEKKRDYFAGLMAATRLKPIVSHGSYFQLYSYQGISEEGEKAFAQRLTREFGVATIPTAAFYSDGTDQKVLRFCFAKQESTLEAAAKRLVNL